MARTRVEALLLVVVLLGDQVHEAVLARVRVRGRVSYSLGLGTG